MNKIKTVGLLAALTAVFLYAGQALGGGAGFGIALLLAGGMNVAAYWWSDTIVLRMSGAKAIGPAEEPELHESVRRLARQAGLPMPKLYLIPQETPNAFATGRNPEKGAVAVTEGLLKLLKRDEVEGVLAHELGHIKNRDTLIMTVAATLGGALSMLADMAFWGNMFGGRGDHDSEGGTHPLAGLAGIILAPLAAMLIQTAISRAREFEADAAGARLTDNPLALARALQKIEQWAKKIPQDSGTPATAHLFIINPFRGGGLTRMFSTHPPTAERVKKLESMANARQKQLA